VDSSQVPPAGLSPNQFRGVTQLSALPAFKDLLRKLDSPDFQAWLQTDAPEMNVPTLWDVTSTLTPVGESLHKLLIIQVCLPLSGVSLFLRCQYLVIANLILCENLPEFISFS